MHQLAVAYADIVVLGVAVLSCLLLAFNVSVRGAVAAIMRRSLQVWRWTASATAAILDVLLPISARNAAVSRRALVLWVLLNLSPVAAWCAPPDIWLPARRGDAALAAAGLALFNLVFLTGAYWALKEGVLFMNGDMPLRHRHFRDLSTATNMPLLVATAGVVLCQVAVLQHWLQTKHGVVLIVMRDGRGMAYIDHLVAVLESLPVVSLLFSPTSLADQTEPVPGWGTFWARSIATFGSFLLVSIFLGVVQQRAALQHLLCRLLLQSEGTPMEALLRQRLLRAPPIVKRDLRLAFLTEDDDKRRLRLLDLALAKHSFSAPAYFLRAYGRASPAVQAGGTAMAATFLARHAHQLDRDGAREVVSAALAAYTARALRGPAHLTRAGSLVLPCLLRLAEIAGASGGEPREVTAFVPTTGATIGAALPITAGRAASLPVSASGACRSRVPAANAGACIAFVDPDLIAPEAPIYWLTEPGTPTLHALSKRAQVGAHADLVLPQIASIRHIVIGPDRVEHLLIRTTQASLTIALTGHRASQAPVRLTFQIPASPTIEQAAATLASYPDLMGMRPRRARRTRYQQFIRDSFMAVDGRTAGASHREVAEAVFGHRRMREDWSGRGGWMKEHVRRALAKGQAMRGGGHLRSIEKACRFRS